MEHARLYDAQGADELVFLDISATHEGRQTMLDVVRQVAVSARWRTCARCCAEQGVAIRPPS